MRVEVSGDKTDRGDMVPLPTPHGKLVGAPVCQGQRLWTRSGCVWRACTRRKWHSAEIGNKRPCPGGWGRQMEVLFCRPCPGWKRNDEGIGVPMGREDWQGGDLGSIGLSLELGHGGPRSDISGRLGLPARRTGEGRGTGGGGDANAGMAQARSS